MLPGAPSLLAYVDSNLITAFLALHDAVKTYPRLTAAEIVGPWREQGGVADENTKIGCGWRRAVQQASLAGPTAAADVGARGTAPPLFAVWDISIFRERHFCGNEHNNICSQNTQIDES